MFERYYNNFCNKFLWNVLHGFYDKYYEDKTEDEETHRILRQGIKVCCEDGETLTGYVSHYVNGNAAATDIKNWFIFQPGTYPTTYSRVDRGAQKDEDVTIEEL